VSRWTALALAALVAATACGIVAALERHNHSCTIEGAYFERSVGAPAYAGVFNSDCNGFSTSNPNLWLGAAVAFALMGLLVLVLTRLRRPST
jgi:hypothetical protein